MQRNHFVKQDLLEILEDGKLHPREELCKVIGGVRKVDSLKVHLYDFKKEGYKLKRVICYQMED